MTARRVSVVVNTLNRADSLRRTLEALEWLEGPEFEVVVVNGPSTDATPEVLAEFEGRIKVGNCPERNLSMSRNIGIMLAAGDIVAFIDDDAYPDPAWLSRLAAAYDREEVAGAGGPVYDHTGAIFQARYSVATRFGRARVEETVNPTDYLARPNSREFVYLIGTNSSYRRVRLVEIGGFDEEFEYFLDETDVCCRLLDRGWLICALDDGFVYHKFLPSEVRTATRSLKDRYSVLKNTCYFALKHGLAYGSLAAVSQEMAAFLEDQRHDVAWNVEHGYLDEADRERFETDIPRAFNDGYRAYALRGPRTRSTGEFADPPPFRAFPTRVPPSNRLHVCFFSQEWPPRPLNGIARVIHTLAGGLAAEGHVVRVLTAGEGHDRVDFEGGVWVHRVVVRPHRQPVDLSVPTHIWDYSSSLLDELRRVDAHRRVDIVQAPNWDAEGVAALLDGGFKVVVGIYTPLRTVRAVDPAFAAPSEMLDKLVALEELSYRQAAGLLACGPTIVDEIETRYGLTIRDDRLGMVAHGLPDAALATQPLRPPGGIEVLFVGRLEPRKGIDTLLESIPALAADFPSAHFTIVGNDRITDESGTSWRERFEDSPTGALLRDRVTFTGLLPDDEVRARYAGCDVFVAPSRFESFGLILLEAMMFGKPVVACDVGGMAEIVEDGVSGLLVPPGDAGALGEALATLLRSEDLRTEMGRRGRQIFVERYSVEQMVTGVTRYYEKLLGLPACTVDDRAQQARERLGQPKVTTPSLSPPVASEPKEPSSVTPPWRGDMVRDPLIAHLVCPDCRAGIVVHASVVTEDGRVKSGEAICPTCATVKARIDQFKFDFHSSGARPGPGTPSRVIETLGELRIPGDQATLVTTGAWQNLGGGRVASAGAVGDAVDYTGRFTDAVVRMVSHPAGGIVDLFVDDILTVSADLHRDSGSAVIGVTAAADLDFREHHLSVRPRGATDDSRQAQVHVEEIVLLGPTSAGGFSKPGPINRGNPYSEVIERYLAATADDLVLEVGGGDRRRASSGHLNFEYLKFELADFYGDIHRLPFADGSFGFVFSQAVFEHVANPFEAAEELIRVTRPGGLILTEVAFMQPLHAVPYHFFNMTPWGVAELFKSCETVEADWFGELSFTVDWLLRSANLAQKIPGDRLDRLVEEFRQLDQLVTHDELRPIASGVYIVVRKPKPAT